MSFLSLKSFFAFKKGASFPLYFKKGYCLRCIIKPLNLKERVASWLFFVLIRKDCCRKMNERVLITWLVSSYHFLFILSYFMPHYLKMSRLLLVLMTYIYYKKELLVMLVNYISLHISLNWTFIQKNVITWNDYLKCARTYSFYCIDFTVTIWEVFYSFVNHVAQVFSLSLLSIRILARGYLLANRKWKLFKNECKQRNFPIARLNKIFREKVASC